MSDQLFLNAIRANPNDDLPRLVYADWLEEQGNTIRAEFIRIQCELASTPEHEPRYRLLEDREHELLSRHEQQFLGSGWPTNWTLGPTEWKFHRGFLDSVSINFGNLLHAGYLSDHPIRSLHVSSDFGQPIEILERQELHPLLKGLQSIDFAGWSNLEHDRLEQFFRSDRLEQLCELDLRGVTHHWNVMDLLRDNQSLLGRLRSFSSEGQTLESSYRSRMMAEANLLRLSEHERQFAEALRQSPLQELRLTDFSELPQGLIRTLLQSPRVSGLQTLDLDSNRQCWDLLNLDSRQNSLKLKSLRLGRVHNLDDAHLRAVLCHSICSELKVLHLESATLNESFVGSMPDLPFWKYAESLRLLQCRISETAWQNLCQHTQAPALRLLDLSSTRMPHTGLEWLVNARLAENLTWLGLGQTGLPTNVVKILGASSSLKQLRTLHLGNVAITPDSLLSLEKSGAVPNLRLLTVNCSAAEEEDRPFPMSDFQSAHPWQLHGLGLAQSQLQDDFLQGLAQSDSLLQLSWLDLSGNQFSEAAMLQLAESPYLSPVCELDLTGNQITDQLREAFEARLGPRFSA